MVHKRIINDELNRSYTNNSDRPVEDRYKDDDDDSVEKIEHNGRYLGVKNPTEGDECTRKLHKRAGGERSV